VLIHVLKKIGDGLRFPIGVATTSKGDIVVADTGNHFVKIFTSGGRLRLSVGKIVHVHPYLILLQAVPLL
jgi:hypothetical protein